MKVWVRIARAKLTSGGVLSALVVLSGCASAPRTPSDYCETLHPESVIPIHADERALGPDVVYDKHEVSHRVATFAILSNNAYKRSDSTLMPLPDGWRQLCSDETVMDCEAGGAGLGLEAKIFFKREAAAGLPSEVAFAYRGTTSTADWLFGNLFSGQYERANGFVLQSLAVLDKRFPGIVDAMIDKRTAVVATGHSLGGGLAEHMAFCFAQLNVHSVAFDPSPRNWKRTCEPEYKPGLVVDPTFRHLAERPTEDQITTIRLSHTQRVHQTMEVLSALRHVFSSNDYPDKTFHFLHGSVVSRHSITALSMGLVKLSSCPIELTPGRRSEGLPGAAHLYEAVCRSATPALPRCFDQADLRAKYHEAVD